MDAEARRRRQPSTHAWLRTQKKDLTISVMNSIYSSRFIHRAIQGPLSARPRQERPSRRSSVSRPPLPSSQRGFSSGPGAGLILTKPPHAGRLFMAGHHDVPAELDVAWYSDDNGSSWTLSNMTSTGEHDRLLLTTLTRWAAFSRQWRCVQAPCSAALTPRSSGPSRTSSWGLMSPSSRSCATAPCSCRCGWTRPGSAARPFRTSKIVMLSRFVLSVSLTRKVSRFQWRRHLPLERSDHRQPRGRLTADADI